MQRKTDIQMGLQMAALAHDLRAPMCVAAGAAQMALEAGGRDVSAQLRQILQAVGAMDRMLVMMSDMRENAPVATFSKEMLQSDLLAMTADRARQKSQRLSVDLSALEGFALKTDYAALCRLLTNLLLNAIKYTQTGGEIALRTQPEGSGKSRRCIRFIVSDNGMGMTHGFMRRMFLPFERAQGTDGIEGCGLGLSIAKEMTQRLGGRISVHSRRGKGTTFVVAVPMGMDRLRKS